MLRDLLVAFCSVLGAALFSQVPAFIQQYLQRLGGHLDEARMVAERLPGYAGRVAELQQAYDSLLNASALSRPFVAILTLQPKVAAATLEIFEPALPLNLEGLAWAAIGLFCGIGLAALLRLPLRRRRGAAASRGS